MKDLRRTIDDHRPCRPRVTTLSQGEGCETHISYTYSVGQASSCISHKKGGVYNRKVGVIPRNNSHQSPTWEIIWKKGCDFKS